MKKAVVLGAGGFIGGHLVTRLIKDGYYIRGVDLKWPEFKKTDANEFIIADLRDPKSCDLVIDEQTEEVYQLAADMGGASFVFTGEHDADIMHNSALINLNVCQTCLKKGVKKLFYSSSACIYPAYNQTDPLNPQCSEDSAYPSLPDSEYGWEKLFSERLYLSFQKNYQLNVRIARFHNIFGPYGTWTGGREKAPAALCRKIAYAKDGQTIEIFGDGQQTRSFLYVDECVEGIIRLMKSDFTGPVNIGSEEMVTIDQLAQIIMKIANKNLQIKHIKGPIGVRGRNSDNQLIQKKLNWKPTIPLSHGLEITYQWISQQIENQK
jgi:nucleoside-diphosphate-sugar epimerase